MKRGLVLFILGPLMIVAYLRVAHSEELAVSKTGSQLEKIQSSDSIPTDETNPQPLLQSTSDQVEGELKLAGNPDESSPLVEGNSENTAEIRLPLMGFQEWKEKRVSRAQTNLMAFKMPPAGEPEEEARAKTEEELTEQAERLRQLEFNLEIAKGLTIHDYFALYLKEMTKAEIAMAVRKLEPEELSELLVSYRDVLYGAPAPKPDESKKLN